MSSDEVMCRQENSRHKTTKPDDLSKCAKKGIAVKPKKGDALLFFSIYQTAIPDTMSLHGGCPVLEGEKWSAAKWIHVDSFDKIIDNGGSCKDKNENFERLHWENVPRTKSMVGTPELPGYCCRSVSCAKISHYM